MGYSPTSLKTIDPDRTTPASVAPSDLTQGAETMTREYYDPLIMCEDCGQDILQSTAHWVDADEGRVPLCSDCYAPGPDDNPND